MFSFRLSKLNRIFDISKSCAKTIRNIVIYDTINASFLSENCLPEIGRNICFDKILVCELYFIAVLCNKIE